MLNTTEQPTTLVFPDALEAKAKLFLEAHVASYGDSFLKPKSHWIFDVVQQVRRDRRVLDCFVVERLHLRVKRLAEQCENTRCFERSVLSRYLQYHEQLLAETNATSATALIGQPFLVEELPDAKLYRSRRVAGLHLEAGDVVMYADGAGRIVAFTPAGDELISAMVELYTFVERPTERSSRWSCSEPMKIAFVNASLNAFCSSCV